MVSDEAGSACPSVSSMLFTRASALACACYRWRPVQGHCTEAGYLEAPVRAAMFCEPVATADWLSHQVYDALHWRRFMLQWLAPCTASSC
jgi:hypothetical protein